MSVTTNLELVKPDGSDSIAISTFNANMDAIDSGVKIKQTPFSDPSAEGSGIQFIGNIYQNANGNLYNVTKRTVRNASATDSGVVSTEAQTFAGAKTFTGNTTFSGTVNITNATASSSTATGALKVAGGLGVAGYIYGSRVYNAVWNDYAECRRAYTNIPGKCVTETEEGIMKITDKRMMPACRIVSDTFGACMGETDRAKTPIAVAGRVLAIPAKDVSKYKIGDAVCSAPDGTVDIMTRREVRRWPDRIVGIVSEIPKYEYWEGGTKENPELIPVNGRIWIYVR